MTKALVSVIIPVYNTAHWLPACLDSILAQTVANMEVLCIDDCSTDPRCREIIGRYAEKDPRVVPVFLEKNQKQGHARNVGIGMARGDYLYMLDFDDMIRPDTLAVLTQMAEEEKLQTIFFDSTVAYDNPELERLYSGYQPVRKGVYPAETVPGRRLFEDFVRQGEWTAFVQRQFWNASYLRESGVLFPEHTEHEDEYFSICALLLAERAKYIRESFFVRRFREDSVMTKKISCTNVHGYLRNLLLLRRFAEEHSICSEAFEQEMCRIYNRFRYCYEQTENKEELADWFLATEEKDLYYFFLTSLKADQFLTPVRASVLETVRTRNVYIYGAGVIGQKLYRSLAGRGLSVAGFLVSDRKGNPDAIFGHRVRELKDVVFSSDDYVIIAMRPGFAAEAETELLGRDVPFTHDWEEK